MEQYRMKKASCPSQKPINTQLLLNQTIFLNAVSQRVSLFLHSDPLCAAADWRGLHRKGLLCCSCGSVLGLLGDRGGIWECPCCLRLDQVCSLVQSSLVQLFLFCSSPLCLLSTSGMTLLRCFVLSSGRAATQTCYPISSVPSPSVSSSPSSSSSSVLY